jgi:HEAT repeat protein
MHQVNSRMSDSRADIARITPLHAMSASQALRLSRHTAPAERLAPSRRGLLPIRDKVLGAIADPAAIPDLCHILKAESPITLKIEAAAALCQIREPQALKALIALMHKLPVQKTEIFTQIFTTVQRQLWFRSSPEALWAMKRMVEINKERGRQQMRQFSPGG